jgi:exonuclease-1
MGIAGLLPLLKPITRDSHISNYANRRVAIDGYAWMHKSIHGCCAELSRVNNSQQWVTYCLYLIDMLLSFNITVHMVFDGADLPAKKVTEVARAANRLAALKTGIKLHNSKDSREQGIARSYLSRAVDVTPRMAAELIKILRHTRPSVHCTVAPYEADSQLSFFCREGLVDAVISEDSDTIPYACKEIIFKLKVDGSCESVTLSEIYSTSLPGLDMRGFTPEMTIALCVGAGCDYLVSLKGFGIKNSYKLIARHRSVERMLKAMRSMGSMSKAPGSKNHNRHINDCSNCSSDSNSIKSNLTPF